METRITPFDLLFGAPGWEADRLAVIAAQAADADADSPGALAQLPAAGAMLRELLPLDEGDAAHGEVFAQVGALLFQALRFWQSGRHLYRFDEAAFRASLRSAPAVVAAPHEAGYAQLPRNTLWARISEDAAPEPADGFFWNATASRLDLLLVLGLRPGRPGFTLVDIALEGTYDLAQWARTAARPDGDDFANVLPGGELQSYHALTNHAELIKLAALCLAAVPDGATYTLDGTGNRVTMVHG